jgi:hypothetical protein
MDTRFAHIVNFWLKKDLTADQRKTFEDHVRSLGTISTVDVFHLGTPASTDRPVIDRSYDFCMICVFRSRADHDAYQVDPVHDTFRDVCSSLWDRIVIYDSDEV